MPGRKLRRYFRHGLLPQLIVFEAVARLGGVTRAAEALHLAQPTVSMQIKKLAATLEVELLEQRGRKVVPTPAGEAVRAACEELLACLQRLEARLAALRGPLRGVLRLAAEPEARALAAQLLAHYCAVHPGVHGSLHVAERAELLGRLAGEEDDVYLFELEMEGVPLARRISIVHSRGRKAAGEAARFLREALASHKYADAEGSAAVPAQDVRRPPPTEPPA